MEAPPLPQPRQVLPNPPSRLLLLLLLVLTHTVTSAAAFPLRADPTMAAAALRLAAVRGGGEGESSQKVVCVTGANGYVAAELVKQLLAKGKGAGSMYAHAYDWTPHMCMYIH